MWLDVLNNSTAEIEIDPADNLFRCDHRHAAWEVSSYGHAKMFLLVSQVAVSERDGSIFPTPPTRAAWQSPVGMDKLMIGIRLPMRRFAAARNDDAGPVGGGIFPVLHGGCQVHRQRHWTQDALRMVNEPHQLPQTGLPAQIDDFLKTRVMMLIVSDLHELNFAAEMINDLLVTPRLPPLDGRVILSAGGDNPEWNGLPGQFLGL
jgi:hypothetical protein